MDTKNEVLTEEEKSIVAARQALGLDHCLAITTSDDEGEGPTIALRRPNSAEWSRFRSEQSSKDPRVVANALQPLVVSCVIYPTRETFLAMVERQPALIENIGNELVVYAGLEKAKKVRRL
jgi:hypothetical protein